MALAPLKSTWKVLALDKLSINYSMTSPYLFFVVALHAYQGI